MQTCLSDLLDFILKRNKLLFTGRMKFKIDFIQKPVWKSIPAGFIIFGMLIFIVLVFPF